jgi:hypothetical protein
MSSPLEKQTEFNQNIWYESYDPDFLHINFISRVTANWMSAFPVYAKYESEAIMPISNYVDNIGTVPELVSIDGNRVTLRQLVYADIYLLQEAGSDFYNVDRTWIRQYYQTNFKMPDDPECFDPTYLFFVSWIPKETTEIFYSGVDGSPVKVFAKKDLWIFPEVNMEFIQPHMVPLKFKKVGEHMYDDELGIIRRGMPLFDMTFTVSDIMVEKIRKFYASN